MHQDIQPLHVMHAAGVHTLWAVQLHSAHLVWITGLGLLLFGSMAVAQEHQLALIVTVLAMLFWQAR
jgi:hypothetical protein